MSLMPEQIKDGLPKKHKYPFYISAIKTEGWTVIDNIATGGLVEAYNKDEALGIATRIAQKIYPDYRIKVGIGPLQPLTVETAQLKKE